MAASHVRGQLWPYAEGALSVEEAAGVAAHLDRCAHCRASHEGVVAARAALAAAREAPAPAVSWARVTAGIHRELRGGEHRAPRLATWALAASLVAASFGAILLLVAAPPREVAFTRVIAEEEVTAPATPRLESGRELRVKRGDQILGAASALVAGDRLETSSDGGARVRLADQSLVQIRAGAAVSLQRIDPEDVRLSLERGAVAVRASHRPRKAFEVIARGVTVRVVGTVFSVTAGDEGVAVAVAEGRVAVVDGRSERLVAAGERLEVAPGELAAREGPLSLEDREVLGALILEVAAEEKVDRVAAVVEGTPHPVRRAPREKKRAAAQSPAPVKASPPSEMRSVEPGTPRDEAVLSASQRAEPPAQALVEAPPVEERGAQVVERLAPRAAEPLTESPPQEPAGPAVVEAAPPLPVPPLVGVDELTAEPAEAAHPSTWDAARADAYVREAQAGVAGGSCAKYLPVLLDLAMLAPTDDLKARARVTRARCFLSRLMLFEALEEYRQYVFAFPRGPDALEAQRALAP